MDAHGLCRARPHMLSGAAVHSGAIVGHRLVGAATHSLSDLVRGDPVFRTHGGAQMATEPRPARTPAEIEADIERTRLRLQGTVDAIAERVSPANVARRGSEAAKAQVLEADGSLRTTRVVALAVVMVAVVGLVAWRRSR
jgi:hypothetical protein